MKKLFLILGLALPAFAASHAAKYTVFSPDKLVKITVDAGKELTWSVERDGETIVEPSPLSL